ncbi:MAG: glutamate-5-semialdehyde dehydrogenase [Campylobacteraceae bacterium]
MENFLKKAKEATKIVSTLKPSFKTKVLLEFANAIRQNQSFINGANAYDLRRATDNNLPAPLIERLKLNHGKIDAMAKAIEEIAHLREPVGKVLDGWVVPNGVRIEKVSIPIGVVSIIYESRPNVTSDTAALCFKSGNVCVLKGGSEAQKSNAAIASVLQDILDRFKLPREIISILPDYSREGVAKLVKMDKYVDVIVPRGGEGLIKYICENSTIPVIKHDKGVCHVYIDEFADIQKAIDIAINSKCSNPSACNALETLLVNEQIASKILPLLHEKFRDLGTKLKGCEKTREFIRIEPASSEDFGREFLDNILAIKVVKNLDEAISHIAKYGSSHSDAIVTENYTNAENFLNSVDSACVYVNAATRFTDGGEFGFGAEVGISTNKLHARGPMGINELTTYKYKIYGQGQTR